MNDEKEKQPEPERERIPPRMDCKPRVRTLPRLSHAEAYLEFGKLSLIAEHWKMSPPRSEQEQEKFIERLALRVAEILRQSEPARTTEREREEFNDIVLVMTMEILHGDEMPGGAVELGWGRVTQESINMIVDGAVARMAPSPRRDQ